MLCTINDPHPLRDAIPTLHMLRPFPDWMRLYSFWRIPAGYIMKFWRDHRSAPRQIPACVACLHPARRGSDRAVYAAGRGRGSDPDGVVDRARHGAEIRLAAGSESYVLLGWVFDIFLVCAGLVSPYFSCRHAADCWISGVAASACTAGPQEPIGCHNFGA